MDWSSPSDSKPGEFSYGQGNSARTASTYRAPYRRPLRAEELPTTPAALDTAREMGRLLPLVQIRRAAESDNTTLQQAGTQLPQGAWAPQSEMMNPTGSFAEASRMMTAPQMSVSFPKQQPRTEQGPASSLQLCAPQQTRELSPKTYQKPRSGPQLCAPHQAQEVPPKTEQGPASSLQRHPSQQTQQSLPSSEQGPTSGLQLHSRQQTQEVSTVINKPNRLTSPEQVHNRQVEIALQGIEMPFSEAVKTYERTQAILPHGYLPPWERPIKGKKASTLSNAGEYSRLTDSELSTRADIPANGSYGNEPRSRQGQYTVRNSSGGRRIDNYVVINVGGAGNSDGKQGSGGIPSITINASEEAVRRISPSFQSGLNDSAHAPRKIAQPYQMQAAGPGVQQASFPPHQQCGSPGISIFMSVQPTDDGKVSGPANASESRVLPDAT